MSASQPHRFFLIASLLFGLALGTLTPPFHVPDEPSHFFRAYRLSEGRLDLIPTPRAHSRPLPRSVFELANTGLAGIKFETHLTLPEGTFERLAKIRLEPRERILVHFPQTLQYTAVPYLVPATAILVGRMAGAEPLALFYLARLANLIFGTVAVVAALRLLPAMRWWLTALALMPMASALRASLSADVLGMSAAVVVTAVSWRMASAEAGPIHRRHLLLATVGSALLCAARPPYAPLALLPLLASGSRLPARRPWLWRAAHVALASAATAWGFVTAVRVGYTKAGSGIDPSAQLEFAVRNPLVPTEAILADYWSNTDRYLSQMIGKLGWLDTPLPVALRAGCLLFLLALLVVDGGPTLAIGARARVAVGLVLAASLVGIAGSQYLVWTPVGGERIPAGIQGRYYLPLALAVAWLLHRRPLGDMEWQRLLPRITLGVVVAVAAVTLWVVRARYYG